MADAAALPDMVAEGVSRSTTSRELPANIDGVVDEDECRICRSPGEPGNPLRYPCACRGTIKYVHQDCLLQWLNRRKISHCEVCKHEYSYAPVYASDAPARLPPQEFVIGLAAKLFHLLRIFRHFVYLLVIWLLAIPFVTHWIWEFAFFKGFSEFKILFTSHLTVAAIFADCMHGFLLSLGMAYIFLGIAFIRISFLQEPIGAPGLANRILAGNEIAENAGRRQGVPDVLQLIKRIVAFLFNWWKMLISRIVIYLGIVEIVPPNEFGNMQFPFDENAFAVVASNMVFVVVLVLLPFCLGRTATFLQYWFFTHDTAETVSSVVSMIEIALLSVSNTTKDALNAITYFILYHRGVSMPSQVLKGDSKILNTEIIKMNKASISVNGLVSAGLLNEQLDGTLSLSDDATLFIGYMVILSFILLYLGTVSMMRYARGEPLTLQRLSGIASKINALWCLIRRFFTLFRQVMTMVSRNFLAIVKVSVILGVNFGIFPVICGWWLDVCTLRIFGQTITGRIAFLVNNPILLSLAYWTVGISYLIYVFVHVNLMKEVFRDGVFFFFPDIADPENYFGRMIECPVFKHARGFLLLVGVHGSLIVMLVFLPIKLVILYAPSVFPLNLFSEAKSVAAFSLRRCLFHFGVPCTIRFYYPSATFKVLIQKWLTVTCSLLSLSDFLHPRHENNDGNVEPLRQQRAHNVSTVALIEGPNAGLRTSGSDATDDAKGEEGQEADYRFVLRVIILLVLAWMTALVFNSLMMAIPVLLGRTFFQAASHLLLSHGFKYDDFCSFIIGSCMMRAVIICGKYAVEHVQTRGVGALLSQMGHSCMNAFKFCAVVSSVMFVIPVVIGLLLDLVVVVPIRLPLDEGTVSTLFQCWVLGWLFLITLFGLVMVDNVHSVDERWLVKLQRTVSDGLAHQPALWLLKEILVPTTTRILIALCTPCMLVRLAFSVLGYPFPVKSAIHRFFWPGCFAFSILWFSSKIIYAFIIYLHNRIRDDRYCVGRRLQDYGESTQRKLVEEENALALQNQ
ncbi:probable E3 ubiquitin ligase SUD1 isoform X2 [Humulus lupulus]|uniref:probable E3 ubiquitin ligase SUD1 isoform X2 n=1 Tax=Humulus lupulus TaxID=3486 RepID=UPI002B41576D|nr:probable E3 ubiquitin ligase SUD1 isoform X2 [Humulus lupulus]